MHFNIQHYKEVTSTNDLAKEAARKGAEEGFVIVADFQTAGRGKLERKWLSSPEKNLLFSLLIRPQCDASQAPMLTQIACRSVASVLRDAYGISSTLKHPNDILVAGKKICGILVESSTGLNQKLDWAVIGIGLNVNAYPEELAHQSTCMSQILKNEQALEPLLPNLLDQLAKDLYAYRA